MLFMNIKIHKLSLHYGRINPRFFIAITIALFSLLATTNAHAGKFYFTLGYNFDSSEFDSAEISVSSGGNYASSVDLGGTLYFNNKGFQLISFDVFSSLDSVQEYSFLFAAGVRVFYAGVNYKEPDGDRKIDEDSFGLMPGIDVGYRFETAIPTVLLWTFDYAPNLLTSGDLEELIQTGVLYEVMFSPVVIGTVSYRYSTTSFNKEVEYTPSAITNFENTLGLGIKIRF